MSEKLLPCPFCGSDNVVRGGDDKMVAVFCGTCGACGPDEYGSSNGWNRRAPAPEGEVTWTEDAELERRQAAENKRLRVALERLASSEAFDLPRIIDGPLAQELRMRLDYARAALTGEDAVPVKLHD